MKGGVSRDEVIPQTAAVEVVRLADAVTVASFDDEAGLRAELRKHLSHNIPGAAAYAVRLTIPSYSLMRAVNAYLENNRINAYPKNEYRHRVSRYLEALISDADVSFACSYGNEADIIVLMTKRQAGNNAQLVARITELLAASETSDDTRRLFSRIVEGGPANVPAYLEAIEKMAARETTKRATEKPRKEIGQSIKTAATETSSSKNPKRTRKPRHPSPDLTAVKFRAKTAKLRSTYDELRNVNLDDPALSDQERIGWARSIKSSYETLSRDDYGFQFPQTLVRKAFAIVKREQRHQLG